MIFGPKDIDHLGRPIRSLAGLAVGLGVGAAGLLVGDPRQRQEKPKKRAKDRSKIKAARKQRRRQGR